jgi:hypothetical protein
MTEVEWMSGDDPLPMLQAAKGKKVRKCRLVAVAWARSLGALLTDERSRLAVEAAEQFADGRATLGNLQRCATAAFNAYVELRDAHGPSDWRATAAVVAMVSAWNPAYSGPMDTLRRLAKALAEAGAAARPGAAVGGPYAALVREVFTNPFRPVVFSPSWRTDTAVTLAHQMYEAREFSALPILADAIQDAGCTSAEILDHCRGDGPHVRGCWVVDLVLAKE